MRHLIFFVCALLLNSCDKKVEFTEPAVCFPCPGPGDPLNLMIQEKDVVMNKDNVLIIRVYANLKWKVTLSDNNWLQLQSFEGENCKNLIFQESNTSAAKQPVEVTVSAVDNASLKDTFTIHPRQ